MKPTKPRQAKRCGLQKSHVCQVLSDMSAHTYKRHDLRNTCNFNQPANSPNNAGRILSDIYLNMIPENENLALQPLVVPYTARQEGYSRLGLRVQILYINLMPTTTAIPISRPR